MASCCSAENLQFNDINFITDIFLIFLFAKLSVVAPQLKTLLSSTPKFEDLRGFMTLNLTRA